MTTADEIRMQCEQDTDAAVDTGAELRTHLVPPEKHTFESLDNTDPEIWIVGQKDEYFLTYNEPRKSYGLAFKNIIGALVYLGEEGSIEDAYLSLLSRNDEDDPPRRSVKKRRSR